MKFLVSHVLMRELSDPRLGFVTVLDVQPTVDLRQAKVHLSVLGSAAERSKAERAIEDAKGFIQRQVGKGLRLRNTPTLQFVFEDPRDSVSRIEDILRQGRKEDQETTMARKPSKKGGKAGAPGKSSKPAGRSAKNETPGEEEMKIDDAWKKEDEAGEEKKIAAEEAPEDEEEIEEDEFEVDEDFDEDEEDFEDEDEDFDEEEEEDLEEDEDFEDVDFDEEEEVDR
jgi:ribosome-binding factor A